MVGMQVKDAYLVIKATYALWNDLPISFLDIHLP